MNSILMNNILIKSILSVIVAILPLSIFLGITMLAGAIKENRLQREGIISEGIITYCASKQVIQIGYCFRASNGVVYRGGRGASKQYNAGDTVYVVYLENNPEKHKMIDKYSENDQKILREVQIRLAIMREKQVNENQ
jgi:hypothetical protein